MREFCHYGERARSQETGHGERNSPVGFTKGTTNLRDAISESESLREQQAKASLLQTGVQGVARVTSVVDSGWPDLITRWTALLADDVEW